MKLKILKTCMAGFILLFPLLSRAQFYAQSGYAYSGIKSEVIESQGMARVIMGFGGQIIVDEVKNIFIQPEILFVGKGFRYSNNPDDAQIKFYYIAVPVMIVAKPLPFLSFEGGFEISGLIDAKFESRRFQKRINVTDTYSSWDLGAAGGIGIFQNKRINLNFRYIHGLKKILQYPLFDNFGDMVGEINDVKNRSFLITARVVIVKGR